jgi:quinone-modifying oxidoreductase subunit QmoC
MNMMKAKRMSAGEFFGGHSVKDLSGLQKIIK